MPDSREKTLAREGVGVTTRDRTQADTLLPAPKARPDYHFLYWRDRAGMRPPPTCAAQLTTNTPRREAHRKAARNVVIVAAANKLARISWAVLASGENYHPTYKALALSN